MKIQKCLVLITLSTLLFITGCHRDRNHVTGASDETETTPTKSNFIESRPAEEAIVIFTSGDVQWVDGGSTEPLVLEIGHVIDASDEIRTGIDSWCELQIADMVMIRIDGSTIFRMDSLNGGSGSSLKPAGKLLAGTIAAKLRKLRDGESFDVYTPTTVCSVRGTVFLVSVDDTATTVAVSEGAVTVEIDESIEIQDSAEAPLVEAGEELFIGTTAAEYRENIAEVNQVILDTMGRDDVAEELSAPATPRYTMGWTVEPQNAHITTDSGLSAKGSLSGSWEEGEQVVISASLEGYHEFNESYDIEPIEDYKPTVIVLKALEPAAFRISTTPETSRITRAGKLLGTGTYQGSVQWDDSGSLTITQEGYNPTRISLNYDEAPQGDLELALLPTIASVVPAVTGSIVGLESIGGKIIAADAEGMLYGLNPSGRRTWRQVTTNSPNEVSRPHRAGGRVLFSGIREFVILDPESGDIVSRREQTPNTMHLFGRRSVEYQDRLVYPAQDELIVHDAESGDILARWPLPGGGQMTPVVVGDDLFTVAADGTVLGYSPDGSITTRIPTKADRPLAHAPAVSGSILYFGDRSGSVFAVDTAAKRMLWESILNTGTATPVSDDPAVYDDRLLVYSRGTAYVLDRSNGRPAFAPISGLAAAPTAVNGFFYGGTEKGGVLAVNILSGELAAQAQLDDTISSNGVRYGETILFGTHSGSLVSINLQDPSMLELFP